MSSFLNTGWYLLNAGLWLLLVALAYRIPGADSIDLAMGGLLLVASIIGVLGAAGLLQRTFQFHYKFPWFNKSKISGQANCPGNCSSLIIEQRFLGWYERISPHVLLVGMGIGHVASPLVIASVHYYTGPTLSLVTLTCIFLIEAAILGFLGSRLGYLPYLAMFLVISILNKDANFFDARIISWLNLDLPDEVKRSIRLHWLSVVLSLVGLYFVSLPLAFMCSLSPLLNRQLTRVDGKNYTLFHGMYHFVCISLISPLFMLCGFLLALASDLRSEFRNKHSKPSSQEDPVSRHEQEFAGDIYDSEAARPAKTSSSIGRESKDDPPIQKYRGRVEPVSPHDYDDDTNPLFSGPVGNSPRRLLSVALLIAAMMLLLFTSWPAYILFSNLDQQISILLPYVGSTALLACSGLTLFVIALRLDHPNNLDAKAKNLSQIQTTHSPFALPRSVGEDSGIGSEYALDAETTNDSLTSKGEHIVKFLHALRDPSTLTLSGSILFCMSAVFGIAVTILVTVPIYFWIDEASVEKLFKKFSRYPAIDWLVPTMSGLLILILGILWVAFAWIVAATSLFFGTKVLTKFGFRVFRY